MNNFKFNELDYVRPDIEEFKSNLSTIIDKLATAATYQEAREYFLEKDKLDQELSTMYTIAHIRNTLDTTDKFYESEIEYFHEVLPDTGVRKEKIKEYSFLLDLFRNK